MFKPKGLAGLKKGGFKAPGAVVTPSFQAPSMPSNTPGASTDNPADQEDGSSAGEHAGMSLSSGAPRRPRGLGGLGKKL